MDDEARLTARAKRNGMAIELVLTLVSRAGRESVSRIGYAELSDEQLSDSCRVTVLVHDPRVSERILAATWQREEHQGFDRPRLALAVEATLDRFERRFPGTLP